MKTTKHVKNTGKIVNAWYAEHIKAVIMTCLGCPMYRNHDKAQLTIDEFFISFRDGLDANNLWVKIIEIIPKDFIEEQYAKNISEESGRLSIPSRIALGSKYIKLQENLTDV